MPEALHAEWTKLRTLASTYWLLLAVAVCTVGVSTAVVAASSYQAGSYQDTPKLSLTGIDLGQAVVAVLAVLVISNEYSTGMMCVTLTAMPRRLVVLAAKAVTLTGLVAAAGVIAVGGSLLAGRIILPGNGFTVAHGYPVLSLGHGPTLRAAVGSVLYLVLIALLSLGVATAVRDIGAAIGIVARTPLPVPISRSGRKRSGMAQASRTDRSHDGRACDSSHYEPAKSAHQPVGWPWRARHLGWGRSRGRRDPASRPGCLRSRAGHRRGALLTRTNKTLGPRHTQKIPSCTRSAPSLRNGWVSQIDGYTSASVRPLMLLLYSGITSPR